MNAGQNSTELERIRLRGLSRRLGARFAIDDVSLAVNAGEILGLIGHTGAGKSSVLRLIAGLDTPDSGEVYLEGQPANRLQPHRRGVAMVFQRDVFYPGRVLEKDRDEARRAGILDRWAAAGLPPETIFRELEFDEPLFRQPPETLSGGQGRRASLLRAMFRDTPILLADEPLAGLDLWTRDRVARLLWRFVRALGKSLVVVAHEPVEAIGLADQLAVLHQGRLVQAGTPKDLLRQPGHRVVVSLLQYPPFNDVTRAVIQGLNTGDSVIVDPAGCRVARNQPADAFAIPVRLLRRRWSAGGPFLEWIEPEAGEVFRTPDSEATPEAGFLVWNSSTELHFSADGSRIETDHGGI